MDHAAAAWAARVDRGGLAADEARQLDAWLDADARHVGAFARARAVSAHFDRARALGPAFTGEGGGWAPKRWMLALAAGVAAAVVATAVYLVFPRHTYATAVGETRLVSAPDGSSIMLNTDSKVTVVYGGAERRIRLVQGEAFFDVARDPARPFIVETGGTRVRALGTSFTVRRMPDETVQVLVRQGVVEVSTPAAEAGTPVRVSANTRVIAPPAQAVSIAPLSAAEVVRELSWQEGMIALSGVALREAAAEFARYSEVRIVIDDPAIADRTVTGLFAADNAVGFAQAIATSMNLGVRTEGRVVRLVPGDSPGTR